MENNGVEKKEVTKEEAVAWIKLNTQNLNPNQWRARYFDKLGIEVQQ